MEDQVNVDRHAQVIPDQGVEVRQQLELMVHRALLLLQQQARVEQELLIQLLPRFQVEHHTEVVAVEWDTLVVAQAQEEPAEEAQVQHVVL